MALSACHELAARLWLPGTGFKCLRMCRLAPCADVFAKIKGMISDMIEKLEKEQAEDKELKQWCDKEIVESIAKKEDHCHPREATKIDSKIARRSSPSRRSLPSLRRLKLRCTRCVLTRRRLMKRISQGWGQVSRE